MVTPPHTGGPPSSDRVRAPVTPVETNGSCLLTAAGSHFRSKLLHIRAPRPLRSFQPMSLNGTLKNSGVLLG
ncbi:hypothetical protein F2P81_017930 [Scophthalmus maximus]|uniref:Uncharacterized protein n=1 Tax=Scophthalmus maximus TaxID=52904 RepID=A0A6A4S933_SCOMX|nr:hypothetical protein F2P81_017930 [Scophthalmus maximus]